MTYRLTPEEYEPTKRKLAELERRVAEMANRKDVSAVLLAAALRSRREFIGQLRAELALFEAAQKFAARIE